MPADPDHVFSLETLRRMDREQVGLDLSDAEAKALLPLLRDLFELIGRIKAADRAEGEPEVTVRTERWES